MSKKKPTKLDLAMKKRGLFQDQKKAMLPMKLRKSFAMRILMQSREEGL